MPGFHPNHDPDWLQRASGTRPAGTRNAASKRFGNGAGHSRHCRCKDKNSSRGWRIHPQIGLRLSYGRDEPPFRPELSSGGSNPNRSRTCSSTDCRQGSTKILSIFGFSFRYGFNSSIIPGHTLRATPFRGASAPTARCPLRRVRAPQRSVCSSSYRSGTAPVRWSTHNRFCRCR